MKKGLIQIYTGEGKGKTTAAIGQAIRALGHNFKVGIVFFHKKIKQDTGEFKILKKLGVDIFEAASMHPCFDKNASVDEIRRLCLKGLKLIDKLFKEDKYDLLILDEINICLKDGFLKDNEVVGLLKNKPKNLELILTGRGVSEVILKQAALVSLIQKVKHSYDVDKETREGIEY